MAEVFHGAQRLFQKNGNLPLLVKVNDGDRFASLHADLHTLNAVLFTSAVAEFVYHYCEYRMRGAKNVLYPSEVFISFANDLSQVIGTDERDFLEFSWDEQKGLFNLFSHYLDMRLPGYGKATNAEVLYVSIVEFYRENPSVFKVVATGTVGAMCALILIFGGVAVKKGLEGPKCRAEAAEIYQASRAEIFRQARLEGEMTPNLRENFKASSQAYSSAIAGCGVPFMNIGIGVGNGTIAVEASYGR